MGKLYLFNVYTFCKSLCVINVGFQYGINGVPICFTWGPHMVNMGSPYGLHGVPIYILYLYDQNYVVGWHVSYHILLNQLKLIC